MASCMDQSQSSVLEDELTCPVCLDLFKDPHLLPCGHNFCLPCVRRLKLKAERGRFRCPECRESHRCSATSQRNFRLANIAEDYRKRGLAVRKPLQETSVAAVAAKTPVLVPCDYCPPFGGSEAGKGVADAAGPSGSASASGEVASAVKTCLKCEVSMCQEHVRPHLELPAFREHPLTEPLGDLRKRKCQEHDEMYRYYCMDDKVCVCNACTIEGGHAGHTIKTLKNTMKDLKGTLEIQLNKVERKLSKAEKTLQEQKEDERKNKRFLEESDRQLTALGEVLKGKMDTFLSELQEGPRCSERECVQEIQSNLAKISQDQARLQEVRSGLQGLIQENDPFRFLEGYKSAGKSFRRQLKRPLFDPESFPVNTDTLGEDMEAKLDAFLSSARSHVIDYIDSLCPIVDGEEGEEEEEDREEDEDDDDDDEDGSDYTQEEEMRSEGEEGEEEEEEEGQDESADELYSPEGEEDEEEEEEEEEGIRSN